MARLAFNKGNLEQFKEGINLVFDVFVEMVETPFEHGNCFSHDDVIARLESMVTTPPPPPSPTPLFLSLTASFVA
jgi:hypothetical protein